MFSSSNPNVSGFEDFDQPVVVNKFADQALKITSKNFALQFDDRGAYGALDLDIDALTKLLGNKVNRKPLIINNKDLGAQAR